ncbi:hypothetical protein CVU37_11510 [candidate division BRC1 bacterium HGW-BRC1-1]|nr:MAG: hypothetical protein CVU37_11510 [candidate division BRC1 bacterium HGW-BRC1-1]
MTTPRLRIFLAGAAVVALLGASFWMLRGIFQENHARFLLNQNKTAEAAEVLQSVRAGKPNDESAALLQARLFLSSHETTGARRVVSGLKPSTDRTWLMAMVEYLEGNDKTAIELLTPPAPPTPLSSAGERRPTPAAPPQHPWAAPFVTMLTKLAPPAAALPPRPAHSGVELMLHHAMTGRVALAERNWAKASRELGFAEARGDTNPGTLVALAVARAALGRLNDAHEVADTHQWTAENFDRAAELATVLRKASLTDVLALDDALDAGMDRRRLEGARLWALACKAESVAETTPSIRAEVITELDQALVTFPRHPIPSVLRAELLESSGRISEAYAQYEELQQSLPTLSVALRMRSLAGEPIPSPGEIDWNQWGFTSPDGILTPAVFTTDDAVLRPSFLAFFRESQASADFTTTAPGAYEITLLARGDRAFGLGPRVSLKLDDDPIAQIYVAAEGWDCYPIKVQVKEGHHVISVRFENNSERLPSDTEDRNFYLHSIILTHTEGR